MDKKLVHQELVLDHETVDRTLHLVSRFSYRWNLHPDGIYTLSVPGYKYAEVPDEDAIIQSNLFMWDNFSYLYDAVIEFYERFLNSSVTLDPRVSLPGFHIYKSPFAKHVPAAPSHRDASFLKYGPLVEIPDTPDRHLSGTISIAAPNSGCSTDMFISPDFDFDAVNSGKMKPDRILEHSPGVISLFCSHLQHRISSFDLAGDGDSRITLQTHLARSDAGPWIMYW